MRDRNFSARVSSRMRAGPLLPVVSFVLLVLLAQLGTGARAEGSAALVVAQSATTPDRAKEIAAADTEIRVARGELETARRRFEAGRTASSTDRVNQLEGGGAQTDAYYLRVEQLKADITKAQQRLDRAITARKAIGE